VYRHEKAYSDVYYPKQLEEECKDANMKEWSIPDKNIVIQTYINEELENLPSQLISDIASCYKLVYKQSWHEEWAIEDALGEVKNSFIGSEGRIPIASIVFFKEKVIGFAWGLMTDINHLIAERDMPYKLPLELKEEGITKTIFRLQEVSKVDRLFLYREIAVLKEHRGHIGPHLGMTILNIANEMGYNVLLAWTHIESRAFEFGLGCKWLPFHYFTPRVDGKALTLLMGSLKYSLSLIERGASPIKEIAEAAYNELLQNINDYRCQ
jgi:hypothetical protein